MALLVSPRSITIRYKNLKINLEEILAEGLHIKLCTREDHIIREIIDGKN